MSTSKKVLKTAINVTFNISAEAAQGAKEIYLLCDHNGWEPIKLDEGAKKKAGTFSTTIKIMKKEAKEVYQYRFQYIMQDGSEKFDNDWDAEKYIANPFGGENSVFTLDLVE